MSEEEGFAEKAQRRIAQMTNAIILLRAEKADLRRLLRFCCAALGLSLAINVAYAWPYYARLLG